jgi:hypothetical protein
VGSGEWTLNGDGETLGNDWFCVLTANSIGPLARNQKIAILKNRCMI